MSSIHHPAGDDATPSSPDPSVPVPGPVPPLPTLSSLPHVLWEEILSFLSAGDMCTAARLVSMSLAGSGNEDRTSSADRAAELALASMLRRAGSKADDIVTALHGDGDGDAKDDGKVYDDESSLHLYHLVLRLSDPRAYELIANERDCYRQDLSVLVLALLFGKPQLRPLTPVLFDLANAISDRLMEFLGWNDRFDLYGMPFVDSVDLERQVRRALTAGMAPHSRIRLTLVADRLRSLGLWDAAGFLINAILYGHPWSAECRFEVEFPVGTEVVLRGLSRAELNGIGGVVERRYQSDNGRIGIRLLESASASTGTSASSNTTTSSNNNGGRLVGTKPENIQRKEESMSRVLMDQHIIAALAVNDKLRYDPEAHIPGIVGNVYGLRKVIDALMMKDTDDSKAEGCCACNSGEMPPAAAATAAAAAGGGGGILFSNDNSRFERALSNLSVCLVHLAQHTVREHVPTFHGGVLPAEVPAEEAEKTKASGDTNTPRFVGLSFLREASLLSQSHAHRTDQFADLTNRLAASARALSMAALLASESAFPFVLLDGTGTATEVGEEIPFQASTPETVIAGHLAEAAFLLRTCFEGAFDKLEGVGVELTLDGISRGPAEAVRIVMELARDLGEIYVLALEAQISTSFRSANEERDAAHFLSLAHSLALKGCGSGHPVTTRLKRLLGLDALVSSQDTDDSWLGKFDRDLYRRDEGMKG